MTALVAFAVVLSAHLGWLRDSQSRPQAIVGAAPGVVAALPENVVPPLRTMRAHEAGDRAADLPAPDTPARAAIDALLLLAQTGRADAMHELAMRLMTCAQAGGGSDDAIGRNAVKRFYWQNGHEPSSEDEVARVAAEVDALVRQHDECDGVAADLLTQRVEWLEKSARAGDRQARVDYAKWGLHDMDREDILMQPDEIERRRDVAGEQLQRALAAGDCGVLDALAEAYSGRKGTFDWIFRPDSALWATYSEAARLRKQASGADPEPPASAVASLDAVQLASAQRQGAAIYARYCIASGG